MARSWKLVLLMTLLSAGAFADCVTGTRCDNRYGDGSCRQWAQYQVCGVYCATGRECDNRYGDGSCREWAVTAACGYGSCSTSQVCDNYYGDGSCREWATSVACQ